MRAMAEAEGKRWFLQAKRDLDDAQYAFNGTRYNLACFLTQQSAEKAIKGFLFMKEVEDIWGHSVAELGALAEANGLCFGELRAKAATLDKYYIPTRYPNGLPGGIPDEAFGEEDAKSALGIAQAVINLIEKEFNLL